MSVQRSSFCLFLWILIILDIKRPTVCVTCVWAGVDNAWEQEKLEARKMLVNRADSHTSGARFVRRNWTEDSLAEKRHRRQTDKIFTHNFDFGNNQKTWLANVSTGSTTKRQITKNFDQPKRNWFKDLLAEWKPYFARTPNKQKPTLTHQNEIDSKTCWPNENHD